MAFARSTVQMSGELLIVVKRISARRQARVPSPTESSSPESAIVGRSLKMLEVYRAKAWLQ